MVTLAMLTRLYPNSHVEVYDHTGRSVSYRDYMYHEEVVKYECSVDNSIIHVYLKGE